MQVLTSLLALTLTFTPFAVRAEAQQKPVGTLYSKAQALHDKDKYVGTSRQTTDAHEVSTTPAESVSSEKDQPYVTPLSAYNNGGYFGE